MAEIDDALPNNSPSDSEFVEQEVVTADEINDTESQSTDEVEVVATEDGGAEVSFDPNAARRITNTKSF
jgi:hypothetical protein